MTLRLLILALLLAMPWQALAADYQLGPGDTIGIKVLNFDNLSTDVKVQPDGNVALSLLGSVGVAGKTVQKLAEELTAKYAEFVVKPSVSVTIRDFRQDTCFVLGLVAKPGPVVLTEGMTTLGAIASAGGSIEKADLARVSVTRGSRETVLVNLLEATSDPKKDAVLKPGDIVLVPESTDRVLVLGSVAKPGNYDLKKGMKVLDAITAADGFAEDADMASAVLSNSDGRQTPIDLDSVVHKGATQQNLELKPGDVVFVPKQERRYYVFGEVSKVGSYAIKGGDNLIAALTAAGGTNPTASVSDIGIVRVVDGKPQVVHADLTKLVKNADQSQNVPVQPGDVIYVAEKKRKWSWGDIAGTASLLGVLVNLRR